MKPFVTTILSMAVVASMTTPLGLARGFNFARRHLASTRGSQTSKPSSRRFRNLGAAALPRRAASASFVAPDGSADNEGSSVPVSPRPSPSSEEDEIEQAARLSVGMTAPLPPPVDFGGIPHLDTSSLAPGGAHRVVFVLGGPGAGKGTQSERVVDRYGCVHLSAGELLRAGAGRADYPHADLVRDLLARGGIVPVEISLGLLGIAMDEAAADGDAPYGSRIFLVDGFPRNYDNVRGWAGLMPSRAAVLGALMYDCPIGVLEGRIMERAETSGRSDDNLETARTRFETFRRQTEPIVRALERAGELQKEVGAAPLRVVRMDATGSIDDVWKVTQEAMDSYVRNDVLTANRNLLRAIQEGDVQTFTDLCDGEFKIDLVYEGPLPSSISKAQVDIQDGVRAVVSYDRSIEDHWSVRETREWRHGPKGWKCVSVSREGLK